MTLEKKYWTSLGLINEIQVSPRHFSKAALVVNILKTATTTYLGKQVSYRKETEQPFRQWYNQLLGIFLFCKHIKKYSIVNFQVTASVESVFLLGVLKITKWF